MGALEPSRSMTDRPGPGRPVAEVLAPDLQLQAPRWDTGRYAHGERQRDRRVHQAAAGAGQDLASPARPRRRRVEPVPEPDRARPAPAERGDTAADRQGAADFRRGAVRAG